ncbi:beta-N-acetylhexosaminidase [Pedobacter yulinensis]|uniref:beta-N-acetylhexosaminidase n=1 Tax=Pedobacter yulinensis TaxID=2126353 RepID=A0A2T3HP68_9SPHI|nr:family 20 glycosylhydrolase [Pedobacter yulinensis]PST84193.1 beta-N-acetylhexosaminidase [Pedobacter yulinensis]
MKQLTCILLACIFSLSAAARQRSAHVNLIPEPVSVVNNGGHFVLPQHVTIQSAAIPELKVALDLLKQKIGTATGSFVSHVTHSEKTPAIRLAILAKKEQTLGTEGYQLSVTPQQIVVKANEPAGLFYGVQTLLQLFPADIESKEKQAGVKWQVPCLEITDYPRLGWRGLMFDVARHFFTKDEVKQYIDAMVRYKFNMLHFHLTDDEGWRLEIKGLPKLTEIGAWNVKKVGSFGTFSPPGPDEPRTYGGFYTQDDIRELVKYAKDRFVNIIPEIDVPGHSLAVIASYPELSCTPGAEKYRVRSGEQIMDWSRGAPPIALVDNTLCPANEKVYTFLDTVITQVAKLFPFEYIHMGGDEAPHNFWEKNEQVKQLMKREGLKTIPQVQAYFEKRVEQIVVAKGKKFMAWDEILEGGASPTAAVMSWRGMKYGIEAAKAGHKVVISPTEFAYLDYMQADEATEPRVYASLRLNKSYQFEPVPPGLDPKNVLGAQANLWTEQIYNIRQAEYMTWPRGFAIAESAWSQPDKKDWNNFVTRTEDHFRRLDLAETKYSPAIYDPAVRVRRTADKQLSVELTPEIQGLDIYYSFDNSTPDHFYPKYTEPVAVPKDASLLRVVTYRGKKQVGRLITIAVSDLNKRSGK